MFNLINPPTRMLITDCHRHQSFVAGLILIFNAGQKKKHGVAQEAYRDELGRIEVCLQALQFCGTIDRVAKGYYTRLSLYYSVLLRPYSPELDGQSSTSNAAMSRTSDAATLMAQHPQHLAEIFDQPFFSEVHRQTGGFQQLLPQWLAEDDEMMLIPDGENDET